ncbi:uncharacterized protein GGS22DRAFT_105669 [Annulohypoxylon maeteangense]|uniref:uncharacterized protein n=1 Tax=Annulohypoxylon maeteangense TaxID=1927788 RepID=UPI002007704D|nr:uncharacterized protein GGS22DRAFT_105669 [Annulohypoxylon maeteangense]KAI0887164.1 hypothetical protein GGS22DRAFT_105669 [Annulohypoxylon maeteangense]
MVTTRSASRAASVAPRHPSPSSPSPSSSNNSTTVSRTSWTHAPTRLTLFWFGLSLPLVIWDTGYVLLRPLTMEGGSLHWPLYTPYKLYGEVDHVYGWKAFDAHSGFTAAQGTLNVVETVMYLFYVGWYLGKGVRVEVKGKGREKGVGEGKKVLLGRQAGVAVLVAFSAAVMTLSKTVLYWLNEYFSGFDNIGHNSRQDLILLWIIPNGLWLIFPTYIIYVMGGEIVEGLSNASSSVAIKSE